MLRNLGIVFFVHCIVIAFAINTTEEYTDDGSKIDSLIPKMTSCRVPLPPPNDKGYKPVKDFGYYKFHPKGLAWKDARKKCIEENAHLAIIDDKEEAKAVGKMFNESYANIENAHSNHLAWLGVHDLGKEGEYRTVLGDLFGATHYLWEKGYAENKATNRTPLACQPKPNKGRFYHQPDNGGRIGNQDCAAFIRGCNTMDDNNCTLPYAFFCEKPFYIDVLIPAY